MDNVFDLVASSVIDVFNNEAYDVCRGHNNSYILLSYAEKNQLDGRSVVSTTLIVSKNNRKVAIPVDIFTLKNNNKDIMVFVSDTIGLFANVKSKIESLNIINAKLNMGRYYFKPDGEPYYQSSITIDNYSKLRSDMPAILNKIFVDACQIYSDDDLSAHSNLQYV